MKAIARERYGDSRVLHLVEVDKPVPSEGRVLLRVRASSVNALDFHATKGGLVRLMGSGLLKPKNSGLGTDVSGVVEVVGLGVTRFRAGDEVFGVAPGAFAEYAIAREDRLELKPANRSFEEAAAVPVAGVTALQGIRDKAQVKAGQKVLVNGASGGVGSFAVQIARSFGAEVTGVCSTKNAEMVKSIGAARVIDYTAEDFSQIEEKFDVIYDAVGNRSVPALRRALKPNGVCVVTGFSGIAKMMSDSVLGTLMSSLGNKKIKGQGLANLNEPDLRALAEMFGSGKISPVIGGRYQLSQVAEAVGLIGTRHASGKLVITIS